MTEADFQQLYLLLQFLTSGVLFGLGFIAGLLAWRVVMLAKNQSRFF